MKRQGNFNEIGQEIMGDEQWEERQLIAVSSELIGKCQGNDRFARTRDEKGRKYRDQ
jgi:hypothetical protein